MLGAQNHNHNHNFNQVHVYVCVCACLCVHVCVCVRRHGAFWPLSNTHKLYLGGTTLSPTFKSLDVCGNYDTSQTRRTLYLSSAHDKSDDGIESAPVPRPPHQILGMAARIAMT